jgi:oligopeptide transport system permease protein
VKALPSKDLFCAIEKQSNECCACAKIIFKVGGGWEAFKRNRLAVYALAFLFLLFFFACFGPIMNEADYETTHLEAHNLAPSLEHWFGTDDLGRDVFTRIWIGARISLFIALAATIIDTLIGIAWGGVSAFTGGKVDECMMRIADILFSIPSLLVVILLIVSIGPGLLPLIIAMAITGWVNMARIVRGEVLRIKQQEYVLAAYVLAVPKWRILFRHIIPNAYGPILVTMTLTIPLAIFTEAYLSFLGLGVPPPMASWGTMVNDGLPALRYYPWRLFFPAFFISMTMLCFNFIGDGLRQAFDLMDE